MTMTESKPWEDGRPEMRLTEIEEKRVVDLAVRGVNPGTIGWVFTLADWHKAHSMMNFLRNVDIPGHQLSFWSEWRVQRTPCVLQQGTYVYWWLTGGMPPPECKDNVWSTAFLPQISNLPWWSGVARGQCFHPAWLPILWWWLGLR